MTVEKITAHIDKTKADIARFIHIYKTEDCAGDYYNWNYKDAIAHILEWIIFSKNKLYAIAHKQPFQEVKDVETFNKHNYKKNKEKHIDELQSGIMRELDAYKEVVLLYSEADLQRKDLPTGFSFELWRYMIMDTVTHPVMHLLYHSLKTKKYELFCRLCEHHNEIFYRYADGRSDVYLFDDYIENRNEFITAIKELGLQYRTNKLIRSILKANKIEEND